MSWNSQEAQDLTSGEKASVVRSYGRALVHLPVEALELVEVTKLENAAEPGWHVAAPLWTREEGRSDFSLALTLIERPHGLDVQVDYIHVL